MRYFTTRLTVLAAALTSAVVLLAPPAQSVESRTGADVVYNSPLSQSSVTASDSQSGVSRIVPAGYNSRQKGMPDADVIRFSSSVCFRFGAASAEWAVYGGGPASYSISTSVKVQVQYRLSDGRCPKWFG